MKSLLVNVAPLRYAPHGSRAALRIAYGLQKFGTQPPYFSLTADLLVNDRWEAGGCLHDESLAAAPQLADLIALHLSDADGVPMYAAANGWYWLQGAVPDTTERYHAGNGMPSRSPERCLAGLAKHLRISLDEAHTLLPLSRAEFYAYVEAQRPRWKQEAQAAIAAHGLEVPA